MNRQLMCNGQIINILAKALDNSSNCHQMSLYLYPCSQSVWAFSSHVVWELHCSCTDPYKEHTQIQNMVVDLCKRYKHFTPITFYTNFVLDARISVRPANVIERTFLACQHLTITLIKLKLMYSSP